MLIHHVAAVLYSAANKRKSYHRRQHEYQYIGVLLQILQGVVVYNERVGYLLREIRCDYVHRLAHDRKAERRNINRAAALHVLPQPSEKKHIVPPSFPAGYLYSGGAENVFCYFDKYNRKNFFVNW